MADPAARLAAIVDRLDADDKALLLGALARPVAARLARAERDQLLVDIAEQFFEGAPSRSEQARQLAIATDRYASAGWRHDRRHRRCPHPPNSLNGALWRLLSICGEKRLSVDRIRKLLVTEPGFR
jgi:hypothetical protein